MLLESERGGIARFFIASHMVMNPDSISLDGFITFTAIAILAVNSVCFERVLKSLFNLSGRPKGDFVGRPFTLYKAKGAPQLTDPTRRMPSRSIGKQQTLHWNRVLTDEHHAYSCP